MERKYPSYIKQWRKKAGLTQKELANRMAEKAGHNPTDDPALRIPTTEASLSRIENGTQNFTMATLAALADILGAEEPGYLLTRNPLKEGRVVSFLDKLDDIESARATAVLEAMFADKRA